MAIKAGPYWYALGGTLSQEIGWYTIEEITWYTLAEIRQQGQVGSNFFNLGNDSSLDQFCDEA